MAKEKIWFDMDGTIADFYGVEGWLADLEAYNVRPYAIAKPLVNMQRLARRLNTLQKMGYEIGIISWLSKS
jgi:phosphoglycolate phosphatase-like HAD superfamily hydrolase